MSSATTRRVRWRRRRDRLDEIHELLQRLDVALIVRDPGSARSADAYEGLRRQVVSAASDRRKLLVVLSQLAESVRRGEDLDAIALRCEEWLMQANVSVLLAPDPVEAFDVVGRGEGKLVVTAPAYVDLATGAVIRRGIAELVPSPPAPVEQERTIDGERPIVEGDDFTADLVADNSVASADADDERSV